MKTILTALVTLAISANWALGADAKAGQAAYNKACKSCHGADGTPNAAIAKSMKVEMKDLKSAEVQAASDDDLMKAITHGTGKMKPIKSVSAADAGNVVAYIRSLKK